MSTQAVKDDVIKILTGAGTVGYESAAVDDTTAVRIPGVATLGIPAVSAKVSSLACERVARPRNTTVTGLVYNDIVVSVMCVDLMPESCYLLAPSPL